MMFWYGHGVSGWGWFAMSGGMILFWALIIMFGVLLFRALARPDDTRTPAARPPSGPTPGPTPEQLLAERFARGEIDEDEYQRRMAVLRSGHGPSLSKS